MKDKDVKKAGKDVVTEDVVTEDVVAPLEKGMVEIKLLKDHGGCKKDATRILEKTTAQVLIDNGYAEVIRK